MKENRFQKYIYWGVTAFLVIVASVLVVMVILKWVSVKAALKMISSILAPITYGIILAYLISPVYNRLSAWTQAAFKSVVKSDKQRTMIARGIATVGSLIFMAAIIMGLFSMIIPTVWESIVGIVNSIPTYAQLVSGWIETLFANNPDVEAAIMAQYQEAVGRLITWTQTPSNWMPNLEAMFGRVFSGIMGVFNLVKNSLVGLIVMIYLLNMKEVLIAQAKKIAYGVFSLKTANGLVEKCRFTHQVFGGFIIGKLIDSLIIGILTFVILTLLKMPYAMLISVIIGVTNIIPFFGPFIGAIPSAILLLLVSPKQCLIFLLVILLIQQFDGNILGPKILGDSTGLSSFWVLFSILLFGGLMGPVGMIIGVPAFAVIYRLITEFVEDKLKKKALSVNTSDYKDLNHIDEERKTFVK